MSSWEDEADEILEAEERRKQEEQQKAAAAAAKRVANDARRGFADDSDAPLSDPLAEKMRRQKLVEEADKRLMDDLFSGCERPADYVPPTAASAVAAAARAKMTKAAAPVVDPVDAVALRSYKDCEQFATKLGKKIRESPAKSPAWLRLLDLLIKDCSPKMDMKDLVSLQKKLQSAVADREKESKQIVEKKKKPNDVGSKMKNYQDEVDMLYGDLSQDEEDDDEEAFL
ncbi:translation initiation factor eIF3 subunit [Toxoplasma gondii TgCatPRC2]|uniref:Translation initiation factor eIF3 subunit n=2 Tax=Toxoplasma gondii TaxID=5811 RepID=A0A151HIS6_TOXGO|nr:hypothetical protein TGME49_226980 [Toxoplasma gondii ME49]EPT27195.1 hypothetical protein TGME49_226980 [Toxoplasma gondii ME49]KYK69267.1 translation initiation factor eIF3 subunit [Toxoplasma gondii TgCatPRC2]|eukprot:XP_002366351.1 hypothetical protein TGME49_226980 [Toxoplasma gondii ME49]